ncbi:MAG: glutathione S-transferase family protein [Polyangiales bacterium]
MNDEIIFYHNPQSRGRMAHWMLEEIGAPYRIELLDFAKGEHKKPDYLAVNPMGKIPAIVHRGVVVTEVAAICAYLADAFPRAKLAPAVDDPRRGTYFRWMFFGAGCFEPALVDHMFKRTPVERPGSIGYGTYEDTLHALEKAITPGPWILGDTFSAADVFVGSQIGYGLMTKALEPRPAFVAYVGRTMERPAFKRANEKNEALMAKLKG